MRLGRKARGLSSGPASRDQQVVAAVAAVAAAAMAQAADPAATRVPTAVFRVVGLDCVATAAARVAAVVVTLTLG